MPVNEWSECDLAIINFINQPLVHKLRLPEDTMPVSLDTSLHSDQVQNLPMPQMPDDTEEPCSICKAVKN